VLKDTMLHPNRRYSARCRDRSHEGTLTRWERFRRNGGWVAGEWLGSLPT